MLFVGGKSIAFATNHTLTIKTDTKETSSKDSGGKWQTSECGIFSWSATSENLFANDGEGSTFADLYKMMIARKAVAVVLSIEGSSTNLDEGKLSEVPEGGWKAKATGTYSGMAYVTSITANAPNGDNATFTIELTGTGELKYTEQPSA